MSVRRRVELLRFAARDRSWIVEDDYDSEFRHRGRPLVSLQGMDRHRSVVYVGSFAKTPFPGLRLGYAVVPLGLVEVVRAAQGILTMGCNTLAQAAVADFMAMGHSGAHISTGCARLTRNTPGNWCVCCAIMPATTFPSTIPRRACILSFA